MKKRTTLIFGLMLLITLSFSIKLGVYIQDEEAEYGNMCIRSVRVKDIQRNSIASNFIRKVDFILSVRFENMNNTYGHLDVVDLPSGNNISSEDFDIRYSGKQVSTASAMGFINRYGLLDTNKLVNRLSDAYYGQNFEMVILRDGRFVYYSVYYE